VPATASPSPLVVAVVGTDHHPFDRLVRWIDAWAAERSARVVVQHGAATAPSHAAGRPTLPPDELSALLREAVAVVCHGGPGTISAVREAGKVPIVLARRSALGEHVDDHQVSFVDRLARAGEVRVAADETALRSALDAAVADPATLRTSPLVPNGSAAAARFADLVAERLTPAGPRLRVLFIAGWGRSGSTLLARMLGQVPEVFAAGELRDIWLRGVIEDRRCGCGEPFGTCETWRAIGEAAFGGWDELNVGEVASLRRRLDRPWMIPRILGSKLTPELDADVVRYVDRLSRLYGAIGAVTGAKLVVDSSKIATSALFLRQVPGMDLRALHLVRDPRGVVHSWQRRRERGDESIEDRNGDRSMIRYGTAAAAARYVGYNMAAHGLSALGVPSRFLRYEDLLVAPRTTLGRVLRLAGIDVPAKSLAFVDDGAVELAPDHTVDGNPMRLQRGRVPLRRDEAWTTEMAAARRTTVSALTAPLLTAYGYRLRSDGR
jgi:UDP-N-acetylglucosamine transferase subunit ALG13